MSKIDPTELPGDLIPIRQAAKLVPNRTGKGVHVSTLFRWVYSGRLRAWKSASSVQVSKSEVLATIQPVGVPVPIETRTAQRRRVAAVKAETLKTLTECGLVIGGPEPVPTRLDRKAK